MVKHMNNIILLLVKLESYMEIRKLKAAALKMVECMLVKLFVKLLKVVKYSVIRLKFPEQIVLSLITQRNLPI